MAVGDTQDLATLDDDRRGAARGLAGFGEQLPGVDDGARGRLRGERRCDRRAEQRERKDIKRLHFCIPCFELGSVKADQKPFVKRSAAPRSSGIAAMWPGSRRHHVLAMRSPPNSDSA